jgi:hypothetical protein
MKKFIFVEWCALIGLCIGLSGCTMFTETNYYASYYDEPISRFSIVTTNDVFEVQSLELRRSAKLSGRSFSPAVIEIINPSCDLAVNGMPVKTSKKISFAYAGYLSFDTIRNLPRGEKLSFDMVLTMKDGLPPPKTVTLITQDGM